MPRAMTPMHDGASPHEIVLEVLDGCAPSARAEAARLGPVREVSPTELRLTTDDLPGVRALRRVVAASVSIVVPARRPRELLATEVLQELRAVIDRIRHTRPRVGPFTAVRLEAAGAHTPDMRRLAEAVGEIAGLPVDPEDGDLVVRVRRAEQGRAGAGWEMLVRVTPRPLSARSWRVVDYPGAVNATIAATVLDLMDIGPEDSLLDMTCGSGTFEIEQLAMGAPAQITAVDLSAEALDAARAHQRAARLRGRIDWVHSDVLTAELPLPEQDGPTGRTTGFTRILSNPPWGELHGSHSTNEELHAALLDRAAQLAAPHARLGILTHEVRRMHAVLERPGCPWTLVDEHRFFQKGHHPRLFRLRPSGE